MKRSSLDYFGDERLTPEEATKLMLFDDMEKALRRERAISWVLWLMVAGLLLWLSSLVSP